jgi:hypothetical protein
MMDETSQANGLLRRFSKSSITLVRPVMRHREWKGTDVTAGFSTKMTWYESSWMFPRVLGIGNG